MLFYFVAWDGDLIDILIVASAPTQVIMSKYYINTPRDHDAKIVVALETSELQFWIFLFLCKMISDLSIEPFLGFSGVPSVLRLISKSSLLLKFG